MEKRVNLSYWRYLGLCADGLPGAVVRTPSGGVYEAPAVASHAAVCIGIDEDLPEGDPD